MTDHDPVGNEQRAVDGDLTVASTARVSVRRRQRAVGVRASPRSPPTGGPSPSGWGSPPGWDTPCLTLDRSDSGHTVGPGVFHAIIRPPPITARGLPLSVSGAGCVQRSVGEDHSRWGTHLSGKVNGQAIFNRVGLGRPGQAQMNSLMPDRVASTRATRSVMRPFPPVDHPDDRGGSCGGHEAAQALGLGVA